MRKLNYPIDSLEKGNWFKLICGASFQHLPAVRNLAIAYSLAGADCIDVAADRAVITAATEAIETADRLGEVARAKGFGYRGKPWLMVSLNDGEDPHFRKAEFNTKKCYKECWQPCETICPAGAINFKEIGNSEVGVIADRCYGCGRCLPVCPVEIIKTRSLAIEKSSLGALIISMGVDAIEIHTSVGNEREFLQLWQAIEPYIKQLKLISISCGDSPGLIEYLKNIHEIINKIPIPIVWQTDGRPMSGDIGTGATRATIKLAQKVIKADIPGYVQLAGGTNHATVSKIKAVGLLKNSLLAREKKSKTDFKSAVTALKKPYIAGVAYGSYARSILTPILTELELIEADCPGNANTLELEKYPDLLWRATEIADSLVSQLKDPQRVCYFPLRSYFTRSSHKSNI